MGEKAGAICCFKDKKTLKLWLPFIFMGILIVAALSICFGVHFGNGRHKITLDKKSIQYRFPNTNFDECCNTRAKREDYLGACSKLFEKNENDDIKCVKVTKGSAIVTFESTKPKFEDRVEKAFQKNEPILINGNSTEGGYLYVKDSNEDKLNRKIQDVTKACNEAQAELKDERKANEDLTRRNGTLNTEIADLTQRNETLNTKIEEKDEDIKEKDKTIRDLNDSLEESVDKKDLAE